jgi:hypothetical protein
VVAPSGVEAPGYALEVRWGLAEGGEPYVAYEPGSVPTPYDG